MIDHTFAISGFVKVIWTLFNSLLFIFEGYLFLISLFAIRKKEEPKIRVNSLNSFALVVAAHNEETVIKNLIDNLKKLKYPVDKFDIFVIADHCNDNTAEIARKSGAFVFERSNMKEKGKGNALKWMFPILFGLKKKYDAVCVFDADNLVSLDFLNEMNKKLNEGYQIVQGYRDIKNPFDSWITVCYAITYWISNRLFQLPRHYLGLSGTLTGSGYTVRMDTLQELKWEVASLTEDLEFTMQAALKNVKIGWAHYALIYDEQPLSLSDSWMQRKRWMQGHAHCIMKYIKPVILKFLRDKSLAAFDSLIVLLSPFIALFGSLSILLNAIFCIVFQAESTKPYFYLFLGISIVVWLFQSMYFLLFICLENRFKPSVLSGLLLFPVFNITWVPIIVQGYVNRNKDQWIHIAHTRNISLNELHE